MNQVNSYKVCAFGTYRDYYSRNQCMLNAFQKLGCKVEICHKSFLAQSSPEGNKLKKGLSFLMVVPKLIILYISLFGKALTIKNIDLIYVGYIGHLDMFAAKILSKIKRAPIIFDVFLSLEDTLINDRKAFGEKSIAAIMLRWIDKQSCKLANIVLIDTEEQKEFFCSRYNLNKEIFKVIPIIPGLDQKDVKKNNVLGEKKIVLQYSYFAPLHGLETILDAASHLDQFENIEFHLIGKGQLKSHVEAQIKSRHIQNVKLFDLMNKDSLYKKVSEAHICLGVFGTSNKVQRVIPNKVIDAMYLKKPVITAESEAIKRHFENDTEVMLCKSGDGSSLANCIYNLLNNSTKMEELTVKAFDKVSKNFSFELVCQKIESSLKELDISKQKDHTAAAPINH